VGRARGEINGARKGQSHDSSDSDDMGGHNDVGNNHAIQGRTGTQLGLNAIDQMFFIPGYPFWSLTIIAMDVVALWACAPTAAARTWPPSASCAIGGAAAHRSLQKPKIKGGQA
jgi:hypothetical protein